ncbi:hypothetical protein BOX15_Mlig027745g1 [Macrostomum lignano]|uniref:Uncharacterized protein n=1 Tax=Macrostomum lignano TaxID=282301 RepID=A0A267ELW6_9PLAT|nr:hypothetical protein BOX15_Mlig027745g1 [Macrostomum lignano]
MEVQQELNQLPEIPAEQNKPAAGLQRKALKLKPQPKQQRRPQRRSQFVRNQEQKSQVHQRSAEELQNPTENPFIPGPAGSNSAKCGADTSAAASGNGNATFDQLSRAVSAGAVRASASELSPTSSLKLIGKQLAPSIQQRRRSPTALLAVTSVGEPSSSTSLRHPQRLHRLPRRRHLRRRQPLSWTFDTRLFVAATRIRGCQPCLISRTSPSFPIGRTLLRASVSTAMGDAAACSLTAKVLTRELRVAPGPPCCRSPCCLRRPRRRPARRAARL